MFYVNQLEYPDIKYNHNMDAGGPPEGRDNVGTSGCGLCCACMVVDALTDKKLDIRDAVRLSEENGANRCLGTGMSTLGPVLAEKFGLEYSYTNSLEEAIEHLRDGGKIISQVSHPEGGVGLFTMRTHYITLISTDGKEFCILDPSYKEGKFDIPDRAGKVNSENAPYLYCDVNILHSEAIPKRYHLFSRKKI